ncbi:MAG: hypothetical protein E7258_07120 [Lachnospiraceae bacterium]|nr:hypothetical protein [Lachnospiraceae bacterium]
MKIRMTAKQPDETEFIGCVIDKYHFTEDDRVMMEEVYQEILRSVTPYAIYKINRWITGLSYIDDEQAALVVMTLGKGPDILQDTYTSEGKLQEAYMVDCISNEILLNMYREFNQLYARFHRRYVTRYVFIGEDISLTCAGDLLDKLYEQDVEEKDVTANEYGVLIPSKSVIFYALLSENPTTLCQGICMGCSNKGCPNKIDDKAKKQGFYQIGKSDSKVTLNYGYIKIFGKDS